MSGERIREREEIRIENVSSPREFTNTFHFTDREAAREEIMERVQDEEKRIVDIDTTPAYEFASRIRDRFRD